MSRLINKWNDGIRNQATSIIRNSTTENGLSFDELGVLNSFLLIERTENSKLAHYEDLEEQGRLMELPCKLKNTIDVIFSHNEIVTLMCDGVDENGNRCCLHFWHGMAWNIPKEYLELSFVKIHGVVSDKPDTLYVEVDAKFTPEAAKAKLKEMEGVNE